MSANPARNWTEDQLNEARQQGDADVDALAEGIIKDVPFDQAHGRLGYHQLLGVADVLLQAPELTLLNNSTVSTALQRLPPAYVDYFDPVEAPPWLDEAKLIRAAQLWDQNMLAIIGVLYARSLPSCYLMGNGIPALYQTGKLGQHRFIYQRIYETGVMLDAVMSPGGLHVFRDLPTGDGQSPKRYLWGKGYVAAKKVRLLHASMRVLLTKPDLVATVIRDASPTSFATRSIGALTAGNPKAPHYSQQHQRIECYDVEKLGVPVNQEDLAYTLLTFGLCIPEGLRAWGCRLSDNDCEAFLHTWLVIGHLMGIRSDLLPADYNSAQRLFAQIKKRQIFPSDMGKKLTKTLAFFLQEYLPRSWRNAVPMMLIKTQLSADEAAMITPPDTTAPTLRIRVLVWCGLRFLRCYYGYRAFIIAHVPVAGHLLGSAFSIAGDALIASWRDGFDRRPFYIPDSATGGWCELPGMNQGVRRELRRWRQDLFKTIFIGLAWLITCTHGYFAVSIGLMLWYGLAHQEWLAGFLIGQGAGILVCGTGWIVATSVLTASVRRVVSRRPGPSEISAPTSTN